MSKLLLRNSVYKFQRVRKFLLWDRKKKKKTSWNLPHLNSTRLKDGFKSNMYKYVINSLLTPHVPHIFSSDLINTWLDDRC